MEADLIESMKRRLRDSCHVPQASIKKVAEELDALCSNYEASSHDPSKWQMLAMFLRESLEPIQDLAERLIARYGLERSSRMLKSQAIEDQVGLLEEQLEASKNYKSQYLKQYEDAISDTNKLCDDYSSLQSTCGLLEERSSSLLKTLESTKQEPLDWIRKYEQLLSKQKAEEDQASRSSATEARVVTAKEQAQSAQEEAEEWKRKYDISVREAKAALEKAAIAQERTTEDTLKKEEDEVKEKLAKIEYAEQCLIIIKSDLKAAESKIENSNLEIMSLKIKLRTLTENLEMEKGGVQYLEGEVLKVRNSIKDVFPLKTIKELIARGLWPVPTCFNYLPRELKLLILKWLPAIDLARIGCVSKALQSLASDNDLWKSKFVDEFGLWSEGGEMDWKQSFARSVEKKRANFWRLAPFGDVYYPVFVKREAPENGP